jgi:AraC-like DNA-binding protein
MAELARTLTGDMDADVARLDAYFLRRVVPLDDTARLVTTAVSRMLHAPPGTRVDDVALALGIHVRSLQRHLAQRVGVTPKWMLSRYRVHEAAQRLEEGPVQDWVTLALELGYCDQAHFIHDFGAALGQTPAQYARAALFSDDTTSQDRADAAKSTARADNAAGLR